MNTKLYKRVHTLAIELLKAAEDENDQVFEKYYEELKVLCVDNERDEIMNHPVQWETLADFTEDSAEALALYQKALGFAEAIDAKDYMASISYAMAIILQETGSAEQALVLARQAHNMASGGEDEELRKEIKALLKTMH
ncbi:tetratricopeptide repeat protein [Oceanicoccus sp. KOV_DT_Chl]|uniref:tetratricopeptide repeat protein n=1 Tax=Oceanicoccus sp. KOV_DT_Chl TaxID=1904639 RepID=UPI0011AEFAD7|nr:tetratricopeptide repeat protein [Oceanicoccus sp. KOV_DT_Chl]